MSLATFTSVSADCLWTVLMQMLNIEKEESV